MSSKVKELHSNPQLAGVRAGDSLRRELSSGGGKARSFAGYCLVPDVSYSVS